MSDIKPYDIASLAQLLDGPTAIDWVVGDLIPPGTSGVLAGSSGVGKTWLALDLALSIAIGEPWLGKFNTRQDTVLVVDEEASELLLRIRLRMLLAARGLSEMPPLFFLVGAGVNLSPVRDKSGATKHTNNYRRLFKTVKDLQPSLVVFDSLTRVHRSRENDAGEMAEVFKEVKHLVDQTGASSLLTHHFRKSGSSGGRSGQRIRGSSDIRAFVDYSILVDPAENGVIITHDKSRWSWPVAPFAVEFVSDGDTFGIKYAGRVQASSGKTTYQDTWTAITDQLRDGAWASRQKLIESVVDEMSTCSTRTLDNVLAWRTDREYLEKQRNGKQVVFRLADDTLRVQPSEVDVMAGVPDAD